MDIVLLIEKDRAARKELSAALSNMGFRVKEAVSPKSALSFLEKRLPHLVVLLDRLPVEDGEALVLAIRRQVYVPLLVLGEAGDRASALLEKGADAYLPLGSGQELLCSQVQALMRRSKPKVRSGERGTDLTPGPPIRPDGVGPIASLRPSRHGKGEPELPSPTRGDRGGFFPSPSMGED